MKEPKTGADEISVCVHDFKDGKLEHVQGTNLVPGRALVLVFDKDDERLDEPIQMVIARDGEGDFVITLTTPRDAKEADPNLGYTMEELKQLHAAGAVNSLNENRVLLSDSKLPFVLGVLHNSYLRAQRALAEYFSHPDDPEKVRELTRVLREFISRADPYVGKAARKRTLGPQEGKVSDGL